MELEALVKQHGGSVFQSEAARKHMIIIADKGVVRILSEPTLISRARPGRGIEEKRDS